MDQMEKHTLIIVLWKEPTVRIRKLEKLVMEDVKGNKVSENWFQNFIKKSNLLRIISIYKKWNCHRSTAKKFHIVLHQSGIPNGLSVFIYLCLYRKQKETTAM